MKGRAVVLAALGVAACLLGAGCGPDITDRATGVEADYQWGTLRAELDRPIGEVYAAAKQAVDELRLRVMRGEEDGIAAEIWAFDAQREQVDLQLGALPESRTLLTIRIGLCGDRSKSIVLFEDIMAKLHGTARVVIMPSSPPGSSFREPLRSRGGQSVSASNRMKVWQDH
jgi:hypothetical protein